MRMLAKSVDSLCRTDCYCFRFLMYIILSYCLKSCILQEYNRQYVAQKAKDAAPPLVYVVSVGFWEREPQIPDYYLPMLDAARQNADALIIVSVPVNRLAPEGRVIMINRNRQVQSSQRATTCLIRFWVNCV